MHSKYHVGNWPDDERPLVKQDDVPVWLSPEASATWKPALSGRSGAPQPFSNLTIEPALTLRSTTQSVSTRQRVPTTHGSLFRPRKQLLFLIAVRDPTSTTKRSRVCAPSDDAATAGGDSLICDRTVAAYSEPDGYWTVSR